MARAAMKLVVMAVVMAVVPVLVIMLVACGRGGPVGVVEEPDPTPRVVLPDESMLQPSLADGGGSVVVQPATVTASQPCTLRFSFTVGPRGIAAGGGVLCYVSSFWYWTPPQHRLPSAPGYTTVSAESPAVELAVETDGSSPWVLARAGTALAAGETLTFVYGDSSGGSQPGAQGRADRFAEHEERFVFKVDGDGDGFFVPIAEQPVLTVRPGPPVRLVCFGPSLVAAGEGFELRVSALDRAGNLAEKFAEQGSTALALAADRSVLEVPAALVLDRDQGGSIGVAVKGVTPGLTRVAVEDRSGTLGQALCNVIVVHEGGPRRQRLLWADLQIHGNRSDGTGTPEEIYRYARDVAGLDAAALTEHDHWGALPLDEHPADWQRICDATEAANEQGRFVTFFAYEWTSWTFGHQHILFRNREDAVLRSWSDPAFDHVSELLAALAGVDCIAIPHHPGGGPVPYCWRYHDPVLQPVVELVSVHGVSEKVGAPGGIRQPVASGMVQAALERGYRLGLIGGGDTHDGHPGLGSPGMPPPGLAAIYAEQASRDAVLQALRQRRVYATSGCRTILRFSSGSTAMGGVLELAQLTGPVELDLTVVGDAAISLVTVVKNSRDHAEIIGDGPVVATTWQDHEQPSTGDSYYLRILQADGCTIWSSPIWVE